MHSLSLSFLVNSLLLCHLYLIDLVINEKMDRKNNRATKKQKRASRDGKKYNRPLNRYKDGKGTGSKRRDSTSKTKLSYDANCDIDLSFIYKIINFFSVFIY